MARDKKKNDAHGIDRRTYMKMVGTAAGATVGAIALGGMGLSGLIPSAAASVTVPQTPLLGRAITKYLTPLPHFAGVRVTGSNLTVSMKEFQQQVLPVGQPSTTVWGYEISDDVNTFGPLYPAFTIEALRGTSTTVNYINNLGTALTPPVLQQYLTVDQTLHWADPLMQHPQMTPYTGPVPAVAHLHGGEVPSAFDGYPESWFTPGPAPKGSGFVSDTYKYPNAQEPTTLWFHDHALGITRLNVYAGLAGFYFLRDWTFERPDLPGGPLDTLVIDPNHTPQQIKAEIEIVIQDRMFDTNGQWFFPDLGINPTIHPFWIPEFIGDAIVVNGRTWPYLEVEPRRYRFRFLNGSNARFYSMRLMDPVIMLPGPPIWQIGTDGGLLNKPVQIAFPNELLLAPGERADVIIDFGALPPGTGPTFILYNRARTPYPKGAPPDPNTTGQIMQFRVTLPLTSPDNSFNPATPAATLRGGLGQPPAIVPLVNPTTGTLGAGVTVNVTRQLTLNEVMGPGGPLEVLLNNSKWDGTMSPNAGGDTEMPHVGSTEQWEIINITADAHPIHLHLVQFQLLNRQRFQTNKYLKAYNAAFPLVTDFPTGSGINYPGGVFIPAYGPPNQYNSTPIPGGNPDVTPYLQGKVMPPAPNEAGWKDTVIMYPGEVTRIVVRYAPQDKIIGTTTPGTNDYPFDPSAEMGVLDDGFGYPGGPGYVWHCHILDHEDNEMMRPYKVT